MLNFPRTYISFRVPLRNPQAIKLDNYEEVFFLLMAVIVAVGSFNRTFNEGWVVLDDDELKGKIQEGLPSAYGGTASRSTGRQTVRYVRTESAKLFGADFINRLTKDIEEQGTPI